MKPEAPAQRVDGLSAPPVRMPTGPTQLSGRLLVVGVILSAALLGVSIWLSLRAEAAPTHPVAAETSHQ